MGRFLITVLLAVGIAGGVAWYAGLLPGGDENNPTPGQPGDPGHPLREARKLGAVLYKCQPPAQRALQEAPGGRGIPFYDCHLAPLYKQEAGSEKEGKILFFGQEVDQENPLSVKGLPTAEIFVDGKVREITYERLREGAYVRKGQVVAMIDPSKALNDINHKKAKIVASEAEYQAAIAMRKEAQERLNRLDNLKARNPALVNAEEYSGAVLTRDKHREEAVSKGEQVKLSRIEFYQAQADLRMHEVRCVMDGVSVVKQFYKNPGDPVKNLDPVMQLVNVSQLRAEGSVEAQYRDQLRPGRRVILEPIEEVNPKGGQPLRAHRGEVNGVAAAADGSFVSGSEDQTVCVWRHHPKGGYDTLELLHDSEVRAVACSPVASKRNLCLAGLADGRVVLWDLAQASKPGAQPLCRLKDGHTASVTALAFSPDGTWFASGGQDARIVLWETATGKKLYAIDREHVDNAHEGAVTALHFTPQGKLVSAGRDNTLRVWALHTNGAAQEDQPVTRRSGTVGNPGVSADGKLMVYDQGRTLQLRSVQDRQRVAVLESTSAAAQFETLALFSPDGSLLLTAGAPEGKMQLWRVPTRGSRGFEVRTFVTNERSPVTCAAFSQDGALAISGTKDGNVYIWELPTPQQVDSHCIVANREGKPLALTHVDLSLEASKIRIGVDVDNPEIPQPSAAQQAGARPAPRLVPGQRVTVVIELGHGSVVRPAAPRQAGDHAEKPVDRSQNCLPAAAL
jgi:WD40 repeat protein